MGSAREQNAGHRMSPVLPRTLFVTRNLPPLVGGMERLNARTWSALASRGDAVLVGPRGCSARLPAGMATYEAPGGSIAAYLGPASLHVLRAAIRFRPGVVLAGSGVTAPLALAAARVARARAVVYLHGLDIVAAHAAYRGLWLPAIRRCDAFMVNSSATWNLAADAGIPTGRMTIVHPGTDLVAENPGAGQGFRQRHGFGSEPLILSAGRLTPRKGLVEFVARALPLVVAAHPAARLVVVGADARVAANAATTSEAARIRDAAARAGLSRHLAMLGGVDDCELDAAYRAANVLVFPILALPGDVEGFGMVAIEAAARGLPTVGFRVGGVIDSVDDGKSGDLVDPEDYEALADRLVARLAATNRADDGAACRRHAARFGWDRFEAQVLGALSDAAHGQ